MKIIDLLNKIANGEEVPKKILFLGNTYRYDEIDETYRNIGGNTNIGEMHNLEFYLNDEVEILEEKKKIPEKLKWVDYNTEFTHGEFNKEFRNICNTIDEIIDYLKSKGE